MDTEVRKYAEERIKASNIRMVPGHYPEFDNKEQVDRLADPGRSFGLTYLN